MDKKTILTAALSGLLLSSTSGAYDMGSAKKAAKGKSQKAKMVHCWGVNTCKGTTDCHTSKNGCAGNNACKGQGWKNMSQAECDDKEGVLTEKELKAKKAKKKNS